MTIYWMRHAESQYNFLKRTTECKNKKNDSILSEKGIQDTLLLRNKWWNKYQGKNPFPLVIISTLKRTRQTYSLLFEEHKGHPSWDNYPTLVITPWLKNRAYLNPIEVLNLDKVIPLINKQPALIIGHKSTLLALEKKLNIKLDHLDNLSLYECNLSDLHS